MQVHLYVESKTYNTQANLKKGRLTDIENKLLIILLPNMVAQEWQCTYLNFHSLLLTNIVLFQWNVEILPPFKSLVTIIYRLNCVPQKFMGGDLNPQNFRMWLYLAIKLS